jgi:hypothetical protein
MGIARERHIVRSLDGYRANGRFWQIWPKWIGFVDLKMGTIRVVSCSDSCVGVDWIFSMG